MLHGSAHVVGGGIRTGGFDRLHRADPAVPVDDVADVLIAELERGRARCFGVSNWPFPRLRRFLDIARAAGHSPVVSYQRSLAVPVNEIWPGALAITDSWAAELIAERVPLLAWAAQARGWFSRFAVDDGPAADPFATARNRQLRDLAVEIGLSHGVPAAVVALAWLLRQQDVWPIVGPVTDIELAESLEATDVALSADEVAALDRAREPGAGHDDLPVRAR